MPDAIAQFAKAKYLNLETFRKTGVGVRTPVWFAQNPGTLSRDDSSPGPAIIFYVYCEPELRQGQADTQQSAGAHRTL